MNEKEEVKKQFGANAQNYVNSQVHAKGASLGRLVELVQPQSHWQLLDIATGAGHTALTFAPHVAHVTITDLTPQMLDKAAQLAQEKSITNVSFKIADAEALPFDDGMFDCVTCRIAPHHFPNIPQFIAESFRVLKNGGVFAVVDNVVPGTHLRGKKANLIREAANYVNAFEKLRDPSHGRCLSLNEWMTEYKKVGFTDVYSETAEKEMDFDWWANRMNVTPENKTRLKAMLIQAPEPVKQFLTPNISNDRIKFQLTEAIMIGYKK